jgi:hypothetical protein
MSQPGADHVDKHYVNQNVLMQVYLTSMQTKRQFCQHLILLAVSDHDKKSVQGPSPYTRSF